MDLSLQQFEKTMRQELNRFNDVRDPSKPNPRQTRRPQVAAPTRGLRVVLGVKTKRLELEQEFAVQTSSISRLQAKMEAERVARDAGWPIVSHVIDYQMEM